MRGWFTKSLPANNANLRELKQKIYAREIREMSEK